MPPQERHQAHLESTAPQERAVVSVPSFQELQAELQGQVASERQEALSAWSLSLDWGRPREPLALEVWVTLLEASEDEGQLQAEGAHLVA